MFFGYMFVDMMSPLQSMIEAQRGWTPDVFGMYGSSEFIFNVFGFLILAGIILDKMGIRFTGVLSASLMFIGASIKYYGVSAAFIGSGIETWLNSWWVSFPGSAKLASLGFMIFGCGMEMAGITVSKTIAKWFEGKEMALAMGLEMAIARVGVFAVFTISPWLANMAPATVVRPVAFCTLLLLIGLLTYVVFTFMDRKLDKQLGLDAKGNNSSEEEFRVSDLGKIFGSKVFWIVAMLCVLYYSAIFPFQRFATNMLESNLGVSAQTAADIFRWFPMGAAAITPL
ncbi:major facilitator superfamily domain-containing protein 1, partial [Akkermansia sp. BIOML-A52]